MSSVIDIESKISGSVYDPNFGDVKQFKLTLETSKKTYRFLKNTEEKYCQLVSVLDGIDFYDIKNFELVINDKIINNELVYIKQNIKLDSKDIQDCYIYKDNGVYIEFLKDDNHFVNCYCYIQKLSSRFFNTPPNY